MIKKLLKCDMTWPRVILISVISAVVTALLNCIPALSGTSFTKPAETLEVWIVLALYIIMNCKGYKEAMCKTFVFFLVSQPLIYLIEVPFKPLGWELFEYYPYWGVITILTIPGAALAYRVKKGDVWAAIILSVANFIMIYTGMSEVNTVFYEFPRLVVSFLFCLIVPFVLIFILLKEKKSRVTAVILAVLFIIVGLCVYVFFQEDSSVSYPLPEGSWEVVSVSDPGLKVSTGEDSMYISTHKNGTYTVVFESDDGRLCEYTITVSGGNHYVNVSEPKDISDGTAG